MQFQSTLPRRERRRKPKQGTNHVNISIHAPAKGATHRIRDLQRKDRFQSTLPRRERPWNTHIQPVIDNFNPRSREGSDESLQKSCRPATFQSTLPRRERRYLTLFLSAPCRFQSTLPRRERRRPVSYGGVFYVISIHAPAKGATDSAM